MRDGVVLQAHEVRLKTSRFPNNTVKITSLIGVGDAMWTRGIVRESIKAGLNVILQTQHQWAFWDFEHLPQFAFDAGEKIPVRQATYLGADLSAGETVYGAMCKRCHVPKGDFKFTPREDWLTTADEVLASIKPTKPVLIYRPLVSCLSRKSVSSRNPDHAAYAAIYASIRDRFHVISVAANGHDETMAHVDAADTTFNNRELPLTTVVALMYRAAAVYTCPGMGLVTAAAMGVPVIGVFGGYEPSSNYSDTVVYGPSLLLDTINPCKCMSDSHACDKRIDLPQAQRRAMEFVNAL